MFEVALADRAGEATFYINTKLSGFSGLQRHGDEGEHQALTVRTARLDECLADRRVDFIKLDVEGGELGVLRGANGVLERWKPRILFECTKSSLAAHGVEAADMFGWLAAQGYAIWTPSAYLAGAKPLDLAGFIAAQIVRLRSEEAILERNGNYWKGWDGNHFDRIIVRVVEEGATMRQLVESGDVDTMDRFSREAYEFISGPLARRAFDMNKEDPKVRDRYGSGQGHGSVAVFPASRPVRGAARERASLSHAARLRRRGRACQNAAQKERRPHVPAPGGHPEGP